VPGRGQAGQGCPQCLEGALTAAQSHLQLLLLLPRVEDLAACAAHPRPVMSCARKGRRGEENSGKGNELRRGGQRKSCEEEGGRGGGPPVCTGRKKGRGSRDWGRDDERGGAALAGSGVG